MTNNFTLIFPALSLHHSNFSDCNVHGGVHSKWFLGFDTSQPKISCKGFGSTKKKKKKKKNPSKPIPLCVESIAIAEQLHPCQVLWKVSLLTDKFIWYVSSNAKITKCRKLWQTDLFLDVFFFLDWLVKFRCDWVFCCCFFNYRANEVRFFQIIFMKMQTEKNMYTLCFQWKLLTTMYCFQAGSSWRDEEKNSYQYWYHTVRVGVVCVCVYISIFISIFIYHMADLYHINLCTVHNSPSSQAHR